MPRPPHRQSPGNDLPGHHIRAGGFPHVACAAAGIPVEVYDHWLQLAQRKRHRRYRAFALAVRQAQALARLVVETKILKEQPLDWLKSGAGRESQSLAGWTTPTKPLPQQDNQINRVLAPAVEQVLAAIVRVLAPYPEARAAVALALAQLGDESQGTNTHREKTTQLFTSASQSE